MNNADKPIHVKNGENMIHSFNSTDYSQGNFEGLTKREYFAGLAMQGLISNPNIKRPTPSYIDDGKEYSDFSKVAIEYADELLKQLETTQD